MTGHLLSPGLFCPHCKTELDGFTGVSTDNKPNDGDVSVCIYCFAVSIYTDNITKLKMLTEEDLQEMKTNYPDAFESLKKALKMVIYHRSQQSSK